MNHETGGRTMATTGETAPGESRVGKRPKPHGPGFSYARLVDGRGVVLALHDAGGCSGEFWLVTCNSRGDYKPARLDLEGVRALRDGCNLVLAEHDAPRQETPR